MSGNRHAAVCIDHIEALIFEIGKPGFTKQHVEAKGIIGNLHHKAGPRGPGHASDQRPYFSAVAEALKPFDEILVVGHGTAKNEFAHFVRDEVPSLSPHLLEVMTVDRPTDHEIVALAREFFDRRKLFR